MTSNNSWGLVLDEPGEGIAGVYSRAKGRPIKLAGFDSRFTDFDGKLTYGEWKFIRPVEPDANGTTLRKGLVSGGVLGSDGSAAPDVTQTDPMFNNNPNLISPQGLR